MIFNRCQFWFARAVKQIKPLIKPAEEQKAADHLEEKETKIYEKKFVRTPEFELSSQYLSALKLPSFVVKKAQKVFSKYPTDDLREAGYHYMRIYQLLHAKENPSTILIRNNKFFENPDNLQTHREKKVIHLQKPNVDEESKWQDIKAKRDEKNERKGQERLKQADEDLKNTSETQQSAIDYDQKMTVSYFLRKVPGSYAVARKILGEIRKRSPGFRPESMLDYGAGVGPWTWATNELYPECSHLICVEPNKNMRQLGKFIGENMKEQRYYESLAHTFELSFDKFDLIVMAYVLEEISRAEVRLLTISTLWEKLSDDGILIVVCPGSPTGFRFINDLREWVLSRKGYIIGPCQHQETCPMAKEGFQWCHFEQKVEQWPNNGMIIVFPKLKEEVNMYSEKFSYLAISKSEMVMKGKEQQRILFPIMKRGKHTIVDLCTSEGSLERRVIAKSHGVEGGYYELKHLKWGDLWRFGKRIRHKLRKGNKSKKRLF